VGRPTRKKMYRILEFVQKTTTFYNDRYLQEIAPGR